MRQRHKRAARRRKRGQGRAKRRGYLTDVARDWAAFWVRWRITLNIPDHRFAAIITELLDQLTDPTRESSEHDRWLAEHVGSTNYEIAGAVIGFNDPDHAFAYRMRWC